MANAVNSIRLDTQLVKDKLQATLDAHKKALAKHIADTEKYQAELVKWAQKVLKGKDIQVEVGCSRNYINVLITNEMRDGMPAEPREKDYPGLLSTYGSYHVAELEEALNVLEMCVDPVINIKALGNVSRYLR